MAIDSLQIDDYWVGVRDVTTGIVDGNKARHKNLIAIIVTTRCGASCTHTL